MKLRGEELMRRATEAGLTIEQLAEAVSREGLKGDKALSAVRNWVAGRDHPRAKRNDLIAMADAIRCEHKDFVRFTSEVRGHRGSAKKAKLLVDLIRGKTYYDALNQLNFTTKRAAVDVRKALEAAKAEAEFNDADEGSLVVTESRVNKGMTIKRFQPKDRGRAHQILKRTSHITVGVEERS